MKNETYIKVTMIIFAVVALMHLYRLLTGDITMSMGSYAMPQWASLVGLVVASYLAYAGYKLKK